MTDLRTVAQQALKAMRCAVPTGKITLYEWDKAVSDLDAALAQQAEPVACCDLEERKALSSVKLPCDVRIGHGTHRKGSSLLALVVRSRSLYQMAKSDDYYGYASRLAVALWEKHYKDIAPQWKPLDDLMGVLTQIDNMTSGLTRLAQQAEPESCAWQQDGDSESGLYSTSCGDYFSLGDGTPEDNKMSWCCYCGKRLVQELIAENEDE